MVDQIPIDAPLPATVACQLSSKRLLSGAEWLAAGTGIVDTDGDDGTTDCATDAPGAGVNGPVNTGSRNACVSTSGTFDQIGNVYEWTLDRTSDVLTGSPTATSSTSQSTTLVMRRGPSSSSTTAATYGTRSLNGGRSFLCTTENV